MTEWGSLSLVDEGQGDEEGKSVSLPGVKKGDMSSRHWKPEVRVGCVHFSPTGELHLHCITILIGVSEQHSELLCNNACIKRQFYMISLVA